MQGIARDPEAAPPSGSLHSSHGVRKITRTYGGHDSNRRRNPLACEMCYKRKIKCEIEESSSTCLQCMRRNITCKFTTRREKRENLKRIHYVKDLEERLRKTESLLRAAGLLDEDQHANESSDDGLVEDESDLEDEHPETMSRELIDNRGDSYHTETARDSSNPSDAHSDTSSNPIQRSQLAPWNVHLQPSLFKWDTREDYRYFGRSCFMSILSPDGIEWIKSKTGETKFLSLLLEDIGSDSPWDNWRPDVFHDMFSSKVFKPLPPRAEVFSLLNDYFRTVNRLFPLFHEPTFMRLVEWQYTQQTCDDAARWASINIIISLAYEYRFSNSQKSEKDREKAWLYYKNAISVFAELTLRRTDVLSVQALLGIAIFLRGNSGTQSASPIITAAIRSCHRMGFHRDLPRPHLSRVEEEQTKRVFWIAYVLDQSACIRTGSSPAQHSDDFDVGFPEMDVENEFLMHNNTSFFRQLCELTVIKSRIFNSLYSTKALQNVTPKKIYSIIRGYREELEEWLRASPFNQEVKPRGSEEDFLIGFARAGLQFSYYNTQMMIHRLPLAIHFAYLHCSTTDIKWDVDFETVQNESTAASIICLDAARDTLKLVNNLPWGDIAWIWSLLYYIFLAVMLLFTYIIRDCKSPNAKGDLQHLSMAATFFATLVPCDGPCNYARFMSRMCASFEKVARAVIERDQKAIKPNDKRRQSETSATSHKKKRRASSPDTHSTPTVDIPQLEGLPPINSSGYVVPESPSDTPEDASMPDQPAANDVLQGDLPTDQPYENPSGPPQQSYPYPVENTFPLSINDCIPQPNLWQIPLTAEWEFGGQLLGLFGPQYFPGNAEAMPMMAGVAPPSAPMNMGNGYENLNMPENGEGYPTWTAMGFMNPF
ncbi:fungal-specific transcription factor domain-containing protein [Aspergillus avenaceus]|uniref:Fungal-specific transcription factor domain-containing protein n=1 Tax=Aspergillus avenaceus TaxID=36643 RepID=A0A5N6TTI2_ASPAV|nr:fungal-specific transcription factor domain-containing protein [Aspergillus avenaceus]